MEKLSDNQKAYAEWLAKAPWERVPATQKDLASDLDVTVRTLQYWQKMPEIIQLINTLNASRLMALVAPATALLEKAIKSPDSVSRVSFDAARYIVQDWAKRTHIEADIIRTISDLHKKYGGVDKH